MMNGDTVTDRWFQAYHDLLLTGRVSQRKVCAALGVDRRNFCQQDKDHSRRILRVLCIPLQRMASAFSSASFLL